MFANPFSDGTSLKVLVEVEDLTSHAGVTSGAGAGAGADATVTLTLRDTDGKVVAHAQATVHPNPQPQPQPQTHPDDGATSTGATNLSATSSVLVEMKPDTALQTWSMQTPATYILTAAVGDDTINITVAVRTFDYKGPKAKLNGNTIELQGFSHHPSFAGMYDSPPWLPFPPTKDARMVVYFACRISAFDPTTGTPPQIPPPQSGAQ